MTAQQLKNSILQMAVQGKLVPQDPNDEPASVLLERIRAEKQRLIKEGKIKRDKNESVIYRAPREGDDGSSNIPYTFLERAADGTVRDITDELPFDVPESWEWVRLGELATVRGGKRVPKGYNLLAHATPHIYIRVTDMKNNSIISDNLRYIDASIFEQIKNYTIGKNDLYLTIAGTIGNVGVVPENFDGMNLTENAVKLTYIMIHKLFMLNSIQSAFVQEQFVDKTNKVAQPKLAIERINTTLFPLPPLSEQDRIVERIEKLLPHISAYDESDQKLISLNAAFPDALKKSILQAAVQGKLVPQDPHDEPASVLLDRIRAERERMIRGGKIKRGKDESVIFRRDNSHYEIRDGIERCIDDEIPFDIPDNWAWTRLGTLCNFGDCENTESVKIAPDAWLLDLEDIEKDSGCLLQRKRKGGIKSLSTKHRFFKGQVLYSKLRPYLNKVIIADEDGYCTSEILPLDFGSTMYNRYAQVFLMCPYFVGYANQCSYGVKMPRLGTQDGRSALVPVPPDNEQRRIVAQIDAILLKIK